MNIARLPWKLRHETFRWWASNYRKLAIKLTHRHATVSFGRGCYLGPGFQLYIPDRGSLIVGENVHFRRGFTAEIAGDGRVTIGDNCIFTFDTIIQCTTTIDVLADTTIGRVTIVDGNHRYDDPDVPIMKQGFDFVPITVGPGALITSGAVVTASVGERTVVGANAVVSRPLGAFGLAVGAPAKIVKEFGPRSDTGTASGQD